MPELYKRKSNTNCTVCKKEIYRRPSELKDRGRVFCSSICYGISCQKNIECVVCGKKMLSGLNKKTCSRSCANVNRAGIIYKINQPKNKVITLRRLKIKILKERGGKCERCNYNKIEILQVHHKNRDRGDNNLKNLELICPNCHYEEHYLLTRNSV